MRYTEPPTVVLTLGAALTSGNPEVVSVVLSSGEELRDLAVERPELSALLGAGVLCNDAGFGDALGGPVDEALLSAAKEHGLDVAQLRRTWLRMEKLPFDPERRLMATLHISTSGGVLALVKGAPEEILRRCRAVGQNEARPFEEKERLLFERKVSELSRRGSTVLAVAYRPGQEPLSPESLEGKLVLLGLVELHDPPRVGARRELRGLYDAGLRVILLSGDHPETAMALARVAGIPAKRAILSGALSPEELQESVRSAQVFARVSPSERRRITEALRGDGEALLEAADSGALLEARRAASPEAIMAALRPSWWPVAGLCLLAIALPLLALLLFMALPPAAALPVGLGICLALGLMLRSARSAQGALFDLRGRSGSGELESTV